MSSEDSRKHDAFQLLERFNHLPTETFNQLKLFVAGNGDECSPEFLAWLDKPEQGKLLMEVEEIIRDDPFFNHLFPGTPPNGPV